MSITDVFLLASKFLPFKDIGTVSIFSLFSKLLAVQLLLIQLTNIVFSQVTSDMIWTEFLIYHFFFFYFCPAFNFADYPPFPLPFLAEMVSFLRFSDRWWRTYQRGTLYGWNLCLLAKLPATFQARKKNHLSTSKGGPPLKGHRKGAFTLGEVWITREARRGILFGHILPGTSAFCSGFIKLST